MTAKRFYTILKVTLTALFLFAGAAWAAARLTIKEPTFDFGFAPQHSELSHTFMLHSTGEDSLKILSVIPGCGCTKAPLAKETIAVGDSTELEVIFSTRTYRNHVSKRPVIKTNEGPPDKHVQFTATVVDRPDSTYPLIITPYKLDLSQFGDKERNNVEFVIRNVSEQKLTISIVSTSPDFFEVKLPESIEPGKTAQCKLLLKPNGSARFFTKSFTVEVNDQDSSRFTVPVKHSIAGDENAPTESGH